jgi:arsenate reductase (glutaredoxin)
LLENGFQIDEREMNKEPLTAEELDELIGERDHTTFLNFRNEVFKEQNMKEEPPEREDAIALMASNPNLIRRPILVHGKTVLLGFDQKSWEKLKA